MNARPIKLLVEFEDTTHLISWMKSNGYKKSEVEEVLDNIELKNLIPTNTALALLKATNSSAELIKSVQNFLEKKISFATLRKEVMRFK